MIHSLFWAQPFQSKNMNIHERILEYAELERKIEMHVPYYEVQALMRKRDINLMDEQIKMENQLKSLGESNMTTDDFLVKFHEWVNSARYLLDSSKTEFNQVITYTLIPA